MVFTVRNVIDSILETAFLAKYKPLPVKKGITSSSAVFIFQEGWKVDQLDDVRPIRDL